MVDPEMTPSFVMPKSLSRSRQREAEARSPALLHKFLLIQRARVRLWRPAKLSSTIAAAAAEDGTQAAVDADVERSQSVMSPNSPYGAWCQVPLFGLVATKSHQTMLTLTMGEKYMPNDGPVPVQIPSAPHWRSKSAT